MRLKQYMTDDIVYGGITEKQLFEMDMSWDILHHIEESVIVEICDKSVDIKTISNVVYDFRTIFNIGVEQYYVFKAIQSTKGIYEIMFYPAKNNNTITYGNLKGKKWVLGVCSGVLLSLEKLIQSHQVDSFVFKTDDKDLQSSYMTITPVIRKRFPLYKETRTYKEGKWLKFEFTK